MQARVYPERDNEVVLSLYLLELWATCKALGVSVRGRGILVLGTCSLQFAEAGSAVTLPP